MNIAFWSNTGKTGVTGNTAAIGLACVMDYPWRITLMENHCNTRNLGKGLLGYSQSDLVKEGGEYSYGSWNMDHFIQQISQRLNRKRRYSSAVEVIEDKLYYVWQDTMLTKEQFEFEFYYKFYPLLEQVDQISNINFIDTASSNNISTKEILDLADLVVVCLRQDLSAVDGFFHDYISIIDKSVFLISSYQKKGKINRHFISEAHDIPINKIGIIPFNASFHSAIEYGSLVEFIEENYHIGKSYFISELKKSAYMIMRHVIDVSTFQNFGRNMRPCISKNILVSEKENSYHVYKKEIH